MTANPLRFRCCHCRVRVQAPYRLCGQSRPCPGCRRAVTIPRVVPEPAGVILVLAGERENFAWRLHRPAVRAAARAG